MAIDWCFESSLWYGIWEYSVDAVPMARPRNSREARACGKVWKPASRYHFGRIAEQTQAIRLDWCWRLRLKGNGQYRNGRLWRANIRSITASRVCWCTPELNQRGLTGATTCYALLKNTFGSKMSPQSCRYGSLLRTKGPKIQLKLVNVKNSSPAQKGRFVG